MRYDLVDKVISIDSFRLLGQETMTYTQEELLAKYVQCKKTGERLTSRQFYDLTGVTHRQLTRTLGPNAFSKLQELAGDEPNRFGRERVPVEQIMEQYALLAQAVWADESRVPSSAHWEHAGLEPTVAGIYASHDIKWSEFHLRFIEYCQGDAGMQSRFGTLLDSIKAEVGVQVQDEQSDDNRVGYVYLLQHGTRREFKIGKTCNPVRREGEIRLQLPEEVKPIHTIETDDPSGVEQYWHRRFSEKRKEGEWFELKASDVSAFKKWKRIV